MTLPLNHRAGYMRLIAAQLAKQKAEQGEPWGLVPLKSCWGPLEQARREVVCNIGQLSKLDVARLNRAASRGEIDKWRGRWHPVPGAPWGLGPLKSCWGPVGTKENLSCPAT